jgi:hypothetical protein
MSVTLQMTKRKNVHCLKRIYLQLEKSQTLRPWTCAILISHLANSFHFNSWESQRKVLGLQAKEATKSTAKSAVLFQGKNSKQNKNKQKTKPKTSMFIPLSAGQYKNKLDFLVLQSGQRGRAAVYKLLALCSTEPCHVFVSA